MFRLAYPRHCWTRRVTTGSEVEQYTPTLNCKIKDRTTGITNISKSSLFEHRVVGVVLALVHSPTTHEDDDDVTVSRRPSV